MRRLTAVTLSILVLLATAAAVPLVGLAQTATETGTDPSTETPATSPGEQFAGVVGVQEAEVEGEIETRRYEHRLSRAETASAKAAVVASQVAETRERLQTLRERRERLEAAHRNGSVSDGQYRARLARLAAEIRTVERIANRSENVSEALPRETLEARGVDPDAIERLRTNASELGGPETAAAARTIAGPNAARETPPGQSNRSDGAPGPGRSDDAPGQSDDGPSHPDDTPAPSNERSRDASGDRSDDSASSGRSNGSSSPADDDPEQSDSDDRQRDTASEGSPDGPPDDRQSDGESDGQSDGESDEKSERQRGDGRDDTSTDDGGANGTPSGTN